MAMKYLASLVLAAACAGCSYGVSPLGPDTYRVQVSGVVFNGAGTGLAQTQALQDANKYCVDHGKQILVINISGDAANSQVDFRCLQPNDPGLVRPTPAPVPNVVIQDQRVR